MGKVVVMPKLGLTMAEENNNQYITPEHLLYALLDQDGGLMPSLFGKMGVDCNAVLSELDTAISGLPKVGGTAVTQAYLSAEADRVLKSAEKAAKSMSTLYRTLASFATLAALDRTEFSTLPSMTQPSVTMEWITEASFPT